MANEDEVFKSSGSMKEQKDILRLLDKVHQLWEDRHNLLEVITVLFSIGLSK